MGKELTITLSISELGTHPHSTFLFQILLDGRVPTSNQSLSPENAQAVREISCRYGALFENHRTPQMVSDDQKALGSELFNLWLAGSWDKIKAAATSGSRRTLVISSDVSAILNLPQESFYFHQMENSRHSLKILALA